ncbi:MAG: glutamate-5-semialdehyde dehydrogenase [Bacteroidetes bacterium GWF2_42_66]|nr:MAG: glutamate-5-semialdehyde dehydrogenase [Bacteroidetes bacterium GWA2_42_15]OFX99389.1 MAG: glutamate-5-semialdehyde dehydrogenase [Bacteroidetes bacterium GWE2_42_39]OFY40441.1 MAG: glutamate-5-semialdehyde dehydrogenase [Bacteroidetes bacterium GWF2_42_66]HBL76939.1 glutamate-5-semialdehyde dehydrogenase [Prolixibacteraceae bacterium]HCR90825.1 glutamate-5-semialdehyde dehydrogenase [Prolixibacteraceae bacterium]
MKIDQQLELVLQASRKLNLVPVEKINQILTDLAVAAVESTGFILQENLKDLARMDINDPKYDRLKLTKERIEGIAADIRNVAGLPSPLGRVLSQTERPNGLKIRKVSVPFGVIGIIYEARPNVTFDVFSLCLKSGNACVLKGGSDAIDSNTAILQVIHSVLEKHGIDKNVLALLPADREATAQILNARGYIDLIIPRGSQNLINFVRENATIPVIETGAGICHTYFDEFGDVQKGQAIINNAKTRRVSICNALDCLIVHEGRLADLPVLCTKLQESNVIIYADEKAYPVLKGKYPDNLLERATEASFGTEFLDYKMAVKTVASFDEALGHIARYSSKHSESIITEDEKSKELFRVMVDAAAVYCNVSTAFTDGAQFGLGAEIGISTQKLHARGPMALEELTSYKWLVDGDGNIRPK